MEIVAKAQQPFRKPSGTIRYCIGIAYVYCESTRSSTRIVLELSPEKNSRTYCYNDRIKNAEYENYSSGHPSTLRDPPDPKTLENCGEKLINIHNNEIRNGRVYVLAGVGAREVRRKADALHQSLRTTAALQQRSPARRDGLVRMVPHPSYDGERLRTALSTSQKIS